MDKAPLRHLPPIVQFFFFLMLWFACTYLLMALQPIVFDYLGLPAKDMGALLKMKQPPRKGVLAIMVLTQVFSFLLPALLLVRLIDPRPARFLAFKPLVPQSNLWITVFLAIGTMFLMIGLSGVLQQFNFGATADQLQHERQMTEAAFYQMKTLPQFLLNLLIVALLPALCEEIFFRGVLQRFINTFLKRPFVSILLTALIFASMHGTLYNLLPIVFGGVILGFVYHITGNIWLNILLHFLNNGLQLLIVFVSGASQEDAQMPFYKHLLFLLLGIIVVVRFLMELRKKNTGFPENWGMHFKTYEVDIKYQEKP